MKRTGAAAARQFAAEAGPEQAGILLHGPDPMLTALVRQEVVAALIGPAGEAEMRLERLAAADIRRDPAALEAALRARGFFPGPRVVLVEDAADTVAAPILAALAAFRPGDGVLVVSAGALPARSALRKGFEAARGALSVALYPEAPGSAEIEAQLAARGVSAVASDGLEALRALGEELDAGAFAQLLETLALYCHGGRDPLGAEDVAAVAPEASEGDIDTLLASVAEGDVAAVGPELRRLAARGVAPVSLAIAAGRHFRALHAAASAPEGIESGLARLRPPVFGSRRTRMAAQAQRLGGPRIERALRLLTDCDLALRSPRPLPAMALIERTLIRIAMLAPAGPRIRTHNPGTSNELGRGG